MIDERSGGHALPRARGGRHHPRKAGLLECSGPRRDAQRGMAAHSFPSTAELESDKHRGRLEPPERCAPTSARSPFARQEPYTRRPAASNASMGQIHWTFSCPGSKRSAPMCHGGAIANHFRTVFEAGVGRASRSPGQSLPQGVSLAHGAHSTGSRRTNGK